MAENLSTTNYPIIYTPQEVISIFREQLRTPAKVVVLEGIYYQNPRSGNYGGYFYDVLRGQNDTFEIRVIVPLAIREKLSSGTLVQLAGTISKEVRNQSIIELQFHVTRYEIIQKDIVTDQQQQLLQLLSEKSSSGYRNVDSLLESILFRNDRPRVALVFASGSITDVDFQRGLEAASSHIDFVKHDVSFAQISRFMEKIVALDKEQYNVLAVVRGGGSGINEVFNTPELIRSLIKLNTPLICGVGHPEEKPFIGKIADKDLGTPSLLGVYFKDLVNRVLEQREKSRAVLVEQVKKQYQERILSAEKQNKELQDKFAALSKNHEDNQKIHTEQMRLSEIRNKELQDKITVINKNSEEQIKAMQKQYETTNRQLKIYEDQAKSFNENISKMQQTNNELQKSLSKLNAQNMQAAKDLAEAKAYAAQLEQQLKQSKKGCLGIVATIICFAGLICSVVMLVL